MSDDTIAKLSDVEATILKTMLQNYQAGGDWHTRSDPPVKKMKYFTGYWFGKEVQGGDGKLDRIRKEGKKVLNSLSKEENGEEENGEGLDKAVSRFKEKMAKGKSVHGVMRQLFGKILAESYSQVNTQVQISAARLAQADSMKETALAITRLAYAQDAYRPTSKLAILFADAIRAIRNTDEKMRKVEGKEPTDYTHENLTNELDNLANQRQYECKNLLTRINDIYKEMGITDPKDKKKYFNEFKGLFYTVKHGFIDAGGIIPSFRKKDAEDLLTDIEEGEIFEDAKQQVESSKKGKIEENDEEIGERLKSLIESRTLLVKNGEFGVMGLSNHAELLAMAMRTRALGMVAGEMGKKLGINMEESFTWSTSGLQTLSQHMSEEKVEEIAENKSVGEVKGLVLRMMGEKTVSMLFKEKGEGREKDSSNDNTIEQLKALIEAKKGKLEGKNEDLNNLEEKLRKETCKDIVDEVKDTALSFESAVKRSDSGEIIMDTSDGEDRPALTDEAKEQIETGLKMKGFEGEAAEQMSENLEEAIQEEMSKRLEARRSARKFQKRKRTAAKPFLALTAIGAMGLLVKKIISFIMGNTRCQALLQNSFMGKAMKKLKKGKVGGYVRNLIQNFYTGFIVGLMSFIGMVVGTLVVRFTTDAEGLKKNLERDKGKDLGDALRENSPILGFLWLKLPTWVWMIISAVLFPFMLVMISNKYLKDISLGKGGAAIFTGVTGIWAYANMNGKDMFDSIPFFVSLSGMLWIWDEFDDFQDAKERMGDDEEEGTGLVDYAELFLLPFVLGFFGALFGMADPLALVIPGKLGFIKYTTSALPKPWNWILHALYRVVATVIGGIVASGGVAGFAIYMIGSVLAQFAMRGILSVIS